MNWQDLDAGECYELESLIAEQLDAYRTIRQQRYIAYYSEAASHAPSVAELAYIRLRHARGWPLIELWPLREGNAHGVELTARAPEDRIVTAEGARALCAVMAGVVKRHQGRSVGFRWGIAPRYAYVKHMPRSSVERLVRQVWPILAGMTEPNKWDRQSNDARGARDAEIREMLAAALSDKTNEAQP